MDNTLLTDALDRAIDDIMADRSSPDSAATPDSCLDQLLGIARELQCFPRPEFKTQLKLELEWQAAGRSMTSDQPRLADATCTTMGVLPTLSGRTVGLYPLRGTNVAASAALHLCLLLLLVTGLLTAHRAPQILGRTLDGRTVNLSAYAPAKGSSGGNNGGGGSHDKTDASKGALPPPSRIQLSPPIVQLQNHDPKLPAQASIVAPPDLNLSHTGRFGDPLSVLLTPSGGTGIRGGIGSGESGGIGSSYGPGFGNGAFGPGNGVSWPRAIYHPEPEFSEEARREHYQGVVALLIVVAPDGRAHDMRILRALGMGLDEKALEAVRTWRFEPGTKDGRPVPVLMEVDIDFRIH